MGFLDLILAPRAANTSGLFGHLLDDEQPPLPSAAPSHGVAARPGAGSHDLASGLPTDHQPEAFGEQRQTAAVLVDDGFDPHLAQSIAADVELTSGVLPQPVPSQGRPGDCQCSGDTSSNV